MRKFLANPYDNPEKCGLEIVETHEVDISYEFDMVVLWKDVESGKKYWQHDSGCSCPVPFEDVRSLSDLEEYELTKERFAQAVQDVQNMQETRS